MLDSICIGVVSLSAQYSAWVETTCCRTILCTNKRDVRMERIDGKGATDADDVGLAALNTLYLCYGLLRDPLRARCCSGNLPA
jgi:hypothetical protein